MVIPTNTKYLHLSLALLALAGTWFMLFANGAIQDVMNVERPYAVDLTSFPPLDDFWNQDAYVHAVLTMYSPPDGIERAMMVLLLSDMAVVLFYFLVDQRRRNLCGRFAHDVTLLLLVALNEMSSAVALPLYSFIFTEQNVPVNAELTTRDITTDLIAVLLGFGLPCWLSFDPLDHGPVTQYAWNMAVCIFPHLLIAVRVCGDTLRAAMRSPVPVRESSARVERCYLFLGVLAGGIHIWTILHLYRTGLLLGLLLPVLELHDLKDKLFLFMQVDHILTILWMLVTSYTVLHVSKPHRVMVNVFLVVGGSITAGPGAVLAYVLMRKERHRGPEKAVGTTGKTLTNGH